MNRWGINVGDNVALIGISMVIRRKATKRRKANEVCGTRRGGRIGCYHNCTLTLSHCIAHPRGHLLPIEFFPRIIVDRVDCKGGSISSSRVSRRIENERERKREKRERRENFGIREIIRPSVLWSEKWWLETVTGRKNAYISKTERTRLWAHVSRS